MEFVDILNGSLHQNAFGFSLKVNDLMNGFLLFIQILHKADDTIFLMVFYPLNLLASAVLEENGQLRIQISRLVQAAFDLLGLETGLFENLRIRRFSFRSPGFGAASGADRSLIQRQEFPAHTGHDVHSRPG